MKKTFSILLLLFFYVNTFAQAQFNESEKIAVFCKVWGFLKYYHPAVANGSRDWDHEFTSRIKTLNSINTKLELSGFFSEWIDSLGKVKRCNKCDQFIPDSLKFNLDLTWLSDSTIFTDSLIQQLQYIQKNRYQGKNYYVQQARFVGNTMYTNEKPYKDSIYPSVEMRLLSLARYWNIINYFYPYKYKIGQSWDEVLAEMIPKFKEASDTMAYHLAMLELTVKINDSHSFFITDYTNQYFGNKWVPFYFKLIDNKAVVTGFYNDSLCKKDDVQYGDVMLKVNDIPIEDIIRYQSQYVGASNEPTRLRKLYYSIFNGNTDSIVVTYERNKIVSDKIIHRYYFKDFNYNRVGINKSEPWKMIDDHIGYVDLGSLLPKDVKPVLEKLKDTKAIIFDVRNYPNGTMYKISDFLDSDKTQFAKFTKPDMAYPGVFKYTSPYKCGKKNNAAYKGKVILLCNEITQSHAEFTLMALQTAPDVLCVGSQTAGADGNVSIITFPGGYVTYMTGIGVYYPDGTETQRIGIVPDIVVNPTIEGLQGKRDEVLEKAIEILIGELK